VRPSCREHVRRKPRLGRQRANGRRFVGAVGERNALTQRSECVASRLDARESEVEAGVAREWLGH